ncbi:MAG: alpha-1,4-glucan--maltose-1-phosphate maltosyltransferase [Phycisphaerales bacterium]
MIEAVTPRVPDGIGALGPCAVKRTVGEAVRVEADIFCDGHDAVSAAVHHRHLGRDGTGAWFEARLELFDNDRWRGEFEVLAEGEAEFFVEAWIDHFAGWRRDLRKRAEAGQELAVEFLVGAQLIEEAVAHGARGAPADSARDLQRFVTLLKRGADAERLEAALDDRLAELMHAVAPRRFASRSSVLRLWVDRERARFSSWYELFPRSVNSDGKRHGTLRDVVSRLDDIAGMGFNVLYLPPVHPIGVQFRKGKNNTLTPTPDDVGSPWAIGGREGGHDALHPALGSEADFRYLVAEANKRKVEIALDFALQCSPDHPYVRAHPDWFKRLPDGTIRYAENPPKKYQDIYPFDFECDDWRALWEELRRVLLAWVDRGVRIFRVDNPHTKPFGLWEWLISEVKRHEPGVLFLAEAFTRPKVMHRLAKLGFTQSYTYFAWRDDPRGLTEYFTELTRTPVVDYFRPNPWPNTPDILTEYLQHGGRGAFVVRAALAATLSASWGVYGPAFELMEHVPAKPGSEEYLNSEKYELKAWNLARPDSLAPLLKSLNAARRDNPALQQDRTLRFHPCGNPSVICYSKTAGDNAIVVAANTDPRQMQWSEVNLDLASLGLRDDEPYEMHDLLTGAVFTWRGSRNVVGLDPAGMPVHVMRVGRTPRLEAKIERFA